eukprot:Nk52_evm22s293 gene=Nk52_evmTU22s293
MMDDYGESCWAPNPDFKVSLKGITGGLLFIVPIWVWIDAYVVASNDPTVKFRIGYSFIPLIISAFGFVMMLIVPKNLIKGDDSSSYGEGMGVFGGRIIFFAGLFVAFGSFLASFALVVRYFYQDGGHIYLGTAMLMESMCMVLAAVTMKFAPSYGSGDGLSGYQPF